MLSETNIKKDKLNVLFAVNTLFTEIYAEMSDKFQKRLVKDYTENLT